MIKLSIIIPVYDVEFYIRRCLDSVFGQNIPISSYEVIIVNDGTPDNSMLIVNEFVTRYSNTIIIHQKNQGLSSARNTGLKVAKGDYVWFIDSDDCIDLNCLLEITSYLDQHLSCILAFDFVYIYSDGVRQRNGQKFRSDSFFMQGIDFLRLNGTGQAWRNIYSRSFLIDNNLFFSTGMIHEDGEFNMRAKCLADTITYIPKIFYFYFVSREGSIMHSISLKHVIDLVNYSIKADTFIREKNLPSNFQKEIYIISSHALFYSIYESKFLNNENRIKYLEYLKLNTYFWYKACNFTFFSSFKIKGMFLYLSPKIYLKLYYLVQGLRKS